MKPALVETDSYVLYEIRLSRRLSINLSNKAVNRLSNKAVQKGCSSGFLHANGGFISKFAIVESEESYSD